MVELHVHEADGSTYALKHKDGKRMVFETTEKAWEYRRTLSKWMRKHTQVRDCGTPEFEK